MKKKTPLNQFGSECTRGNIPMKNGCFLQARGFTCRSTSYSSEENRCYLSADDSVSLMGAPLPLKRGAVFSEKQCSVSKCGTDE
jgi:hypothetical protein